MTRGSKKTSKTSRLKKSSSKGRKTQKTSKKARGVEKLPTSRDVYKRLIWDAQYDASVYTLGYQDHNRGLVRVPVPEFVPDGDIPWHRVWFFFDAQGEPVWDRKARLYTLDEGKTSAPLTSENPPRHALSVPEPARSGAHPVHTTQLDAWRWSESKEAWARCEGQHDQRVRIDRPLGLFRVISFNILFDTFDTERIESALRYRALLSLLRSVHADVVVLQEVTPLFLNLLLENPWVRQNYTLTDADGSTVTPYGQVILSLHPLYNVQAHAWTNDKRVISAEVHIHGVAPFSVAGLHLTSHRARHGRSARARQIHSLRTLFDELTHSVFLIGDFNCSDDRELESLHDAGFQDLWKTLHPNDPGYTFDSDRNGLADWMSTQHSRCRYDRIFLRSSQHSVQPLWMRLLGEEPLREGGRDHGLWLSDHFGLALLISAPSLQPTFPKTTHTSALALVPPRDVWEPIQALRRDFDKSFHRWPPHINLLYGFLPPEALPYAAQALRELTAFFEPFEVLLDGVRVFRHRASSTVWVEPHTLHEDRLQTLQNALQRLFPVCTEQSRHGAFTPHLTIASLSSNQTLDTFLQRHSPKLPPISFTALHLTILTRTAETPFVSYAEVQLGSPVFQPRLDTLPPDAPPAPHDAQAWLKTHRRIQDPAQRRHRRELASALRTCCTETLRALLSTSSPHLFTRVVGSSRLGVSLPTSDLDLVCVLPTSISLRDAQRHLCDALKALPNVRTVRVASVQGFSVLKLTTESHDVDLQLTHPPSPNNPPSRAYQATQDTDLIKSLASSTVDWKTFRSVLLYIRVWARSHDLDTPFVGLLPGISWAILLLWVARTPSFQAAATQSPAHALQAFFRVLAAWDRSPVILTRRARTYTFRRNRDHLPILTLSAPIFNTARNATRSTTHLMRASWRRAGALCTHILDPEHSATWDTLFTPRPVEDWRARATSSAASAALIALTLTPSDPQDHAAVERAHGAFRSAVLTLLLRLESVHRVRVRPFVHSAPDGVTLLIGVLNVQNTIAPKTIVATVQAFLQTWRDTDDDACPVRVDLDIVV